LIIQLDKVANFFFPYPGQPAATDVSGVFRGSAGVLMEAIEELQKWAKTNKDKK